jgi:electron-transferring-flavoprotein dehydrogenase
VEIFPGFAAPRCCTTTNGSVKGVATGNMGVGKDGEPTDNFQLGMELHAKYTVFAEGARGHLGKQLIAALPARRRPRPAELRHRHQGTVGDRPQRHQPGFVLHTAGWPMDNDTYGGAFLYHLEGNKVAWASSPAWTTPTPT